jgi:tetratricopeptide (TPR) repeat protein
MHDPFDQRLDLARKLTDERRFADAITLFNWLCEAYPDRAAAVLDSANAFARVFDYHGVKARFAHVESRAGNPVDVWLAMAQISERLYRPVWTERYLSNAIAAVPVSADAFGAYAAYLEQANDLDRAQDICLRGLKIDSGNVSCLLGRAKLLRRQKCPDAAMTLLHDLLKRNDIPERQRISAYYELAHLSDAAGDYPGAIDALRRAKELARQQPDFEMFRLRARVGEQRHHRFLKTLGSDYFQNAGDWTPAHPQRLALLGGHPRSGTTLLEQVLDSHAQLISAEETLVFGAVVNDPFHRELGGEDLCASSLRIPRPHLELFRAAYFGAMESVLDQPIAGRVLVDKNPSCTDCIPVFARVFPEASYIVALRDPRDVVLSCFFQDFPANEVTADFQDLKQTAMRYANTMAMWLVCRENLDEKKWIEVRYESLVNDLPGQTARVMDHLNLPVQPAQLQPEQHARSRRVHSPTYADVVQPVHQRAIGKWKNYSPWLAEAMPILETFLDAFDYP